MDYLILMTTSFLVGVLLGYYRGKANGLLAGRKASGKALVKNLLEDK